MFSGETIARVDLALTNANTARGLNVTSAAAAVCFTWDDVPSCGSEMS